MSAGEPIPVALFLSRFDPGGTERQMIELLRRLDRHRWQAHLACFRASGAWFDRAAAAAVSIGVFPAPRLSAPHTLRFFPLFARWCRERRIALVHTTQIDSNIFGLPAAALAGVPARVSNRRSLDHGKPAPRLIAQRLAQRCSHVIVANSAVVAARVRAQGVRARQIAIVPNGLDVSMFAPATYGSRPRRVVCVGNLRPVKGHDVLIRAAPQILRQFPDATFHIVGGGPCARALEELAATWGVGLAFTFHGHREDIARHLGESDLFVLPSYSESVPNALLEAMAAGLPVVASNVGGVAEVVHHESTGLLFDAGDDRALARRVCEVMATPALARSLGCAARADVASRFSFEVMVSGFERIYESVLAPRRRA
jgi:glycosyltransferase involved in cell wall biosynthesis